MTGSVFGAARRRTRREWIATGLKYVSAALLAFFVLAPFGWMLSTALKPPAEVFTSPPRWLPLAPTLDNFIQVVDSSFVRHLVNSVLVCTFVTVVCIALAILSSFAISRPNGGENKSVLLVVLVSQLLPQAVLIVPLYRMSGRLGLLNSLPGLAVVYLTFTLPVAIWLLHGFISAIPRELHEAAQTDGLSAIMAYFRVVVPLARPGIAATAAYIFFHSWQDFMYALIFLTDEEKRTLPASILSFLGVYTIEWGQLMAASILLLAPVLLIFSVVQRNFIAGLTAGAVKG